MGFGCTPMSLLAAAIVCTHATHTHTHTSFCTPPDCKDATESCADAPAHASEASVDVIDDVSLLSMQLLQAKLQLHLQEVQDLDVLPPERSLPYNLNGGTKQTSYSQAGQDLLLQPLLGNISDGFFVEAGAFDGETGSNTLWLELNRNWTGLLVEPAHDVFLDLQGKHRRAYLFEGALSTSKAIETATFQTSVSKNQTGGLNHNATSEPKYNVTCAPLHTLLDNIGQSTVDFWSLDIEGAELPVLQATDFDKVEVGVLMVETINDILFPNHPDLPELHAFILSRGFYHIGASHHDQDRIYVNPSYFAKRGLPVPEPM